MANDNRPDLGTVWTFNYLFWSVMPYKVELLREGIIFLIHLFAREILLMKKLQIEETKAT